MVTQPCVHFPYPDDGRPGDPSFGTPIAHDYKWIVWILNKWMIQNGLTNTATRIALVRDYILGGNIAYFKLRNNDEKEMGLHFSASKWFNSWLNTQITYNKYFPCDIRGKLCFVMKKFHLKRSQHQSDITT